MPSAFHPFRTPPPEPGLPLSALPQGRRTRRRAGLLILLAAWTVHACAGGDAGTGDAPGERSLSPAEAVLRTAIETHGGDAFRDIHITFLFRDAEFEVTRRSGIFRYQRTRTDPEGRTVREVMDNDGIRRYLDGEEVPLDRHEQLALDTAVNSVVYFGFLPFRLDDPAVRARLLEDGRMEGEVYRRVEVTFTEEDGGQDWEDRFVYWIHADAGTLDYLAYSYVRGEGGSRFRKAVNRREVGGLLIQDYENYAGDVERLEDYEAGFHDGALRLLSMVELEEVEVEVGPPPSRPL